MDKEKQIEEMAKIVNKADDGCNWKKCSKCASRDVTPNCLTHREVTALYNAGYRKIDKGSIVQVLKKVEFAGKEYDIQEMSMARSTYDAALVQARKEAVKEFIQAINKEYELFDDVDEIFFDCLRKDIKRIAKEFGVEL